MNDQNDDAATEDTAVTDTITINKNDLPLPKPRPVHRLDAGTGGMLVLDGECICFSVSFYCFWINTHFSY